MNIGIVCYASVGGSGVVASELARCLADARPSHARHQQRHAVPAARVQPGAVVPPRRDAELSAVSRAAVSAGARQPHRAGGARRIGSTSSTRTTRFRTPRRRISRARFSRARRGGARAAHRSRRSTAPTSRSSARSLVSRDGRVLHRSVRCRDGGVGQLARRHQARHAGHHRDIVVIPNFLDCATFIAARRIRRCARGSARRTRSW